MDRGLVRHYGDGVAVVTVARSTGLPLDRFLDSLRTAGGRPVQVVVADTAGVAVPDGAAVLRIGEDVGRAAALNRAVAGLDAGVGWVVLADPGIRWGPGSLDALLAAAARHPRAGVLGPRVRDHAGTVLPSGGGLPGLVDALRGRSGPVPAPGPPRWLASSCLLVRRAAWDSVDGFDPRYLGGDAPATGEPADVDLGDRLGRAGWLIVAVADAEVTVHPVPGAPATPGGGEGILETHADGLRRFVHDRGSFLTRALLALAGRPGRIRSTARPSWRNVCCTTSKPWFWSGAGERGSDR